MEGRLSPSPSFLLPAASTTGSASSFSASFTNTNLPFSRTEMLLAISPVTIAERMSESPKLLSSPKSSSSFSLSSSTISSAPGKSVFESAQPFPCCKRRQTLVRKVPLAGSTHCKCLIENQFRFIDSIECIPKPSHTAISEWAKLLVNDS
ncbi:hypothetical protein BDZ97DRAFT_1283530 [Flammula alnicola]|nr:hypothetical protein BDZ97DRAFT_1283530 [Flammula alnicola]